VKRGVCMTNDYRIEDEVVYVDISTKTHPNVETLVDLDDWDIVFDGCGRWRVLSVHRSRTLYVTRQLRSDSHKTHVLLHRVLLELQKGDGVIVDHINRNGLDNRRANLRTATPAQNAWNVVMNKGVRFRRGRWHAHIAATGKQIYLGSFASKTEAEAAYDAAARDKRGAFYCEDVA
jgi:hypothetical protein